MGIAQMAQMTAPKLRWFRWSLRTLFVVVTVFCCWLGYELNWIRQRRIEFAAGHVEFDDDLTSWAGYSPVGAPSALELFGERGYSVIWFNTSQEDLVPTAKELVEIERIKCLFPESQIDFSFTPPKRPPLPEKTEQTRSAYDGFNL